MSVTFWLRFGITTVDFLATIFRQLVRLLGPGFSWLAIFTTGVWIKGCWTRTVTVIWPRSIGFGVISIALSN